MTKVATRKKQLPAHAQWKKIIQERGLKQTWIAEKISISTSHLSNILKGRDATSRDVIDKLNELLGTNF